MSSRLNKTSVKTKNGKLERSGYRFDEDSVANQMAFLFAGQEGQERAQKIREEAEKIKDLKQRKQFIEEEVKIKAKNVDNKFEEGIFDLFKGLPTEPGYEEMGAKKDEAVALLKAMGLNVDPDNVQTHYSSGPPRCFQIAFMLKPTEELKDANSEINKLSQCYANALGSEEKKDFNDKWKEHITNAKNGGPKMDKDAFDLKATESWNEYKKQVKQEYEHSSPKMTPPNEAEPQPRTPKY